MTITKKMVMGENGAISWRIRLDSDTGNWIYMHVPPDQDAQEFVERLCSVLNFGTLEGCEIADNA